MATDEVTVEQLSGKMWHLTGAALTSVSMGAARRLGLFDALGDAGDAGGTPEALAGACGMNARFARELMLHLAASGFVTRLPDGSFKLSPAQRGLFYDRASPFFADMQARMVSDMLAPLVDRHVEAFRTGRGVSYDEGGDMLAESVAEFTRGHGGMACRQIAESLPDVHAALQAAGAKAGDVGCGSGAGLISLAQAYPDLELHGYDTSKRALERAAAAIAAAGLDSRIALHNPEEEGGGLPADHSFTLLYSNDVLHDMTDAPTVVAAGRAAIRPGGWWLFREPTGCDSDADKIVHPKAKLLLGFSLYVCMTAAMSDDATRGSHDPVGTMGFTLTVARKWFLDAGWATVDTTGTEDTLLYVAQAPPA